jgi:predicted N-acetyltransferase YhbS
LDLLTVHPNYEGRGHGRRLTQWGIDQAKKEGIATSVISADGKRPFYERLGFTYVGTSK